MASCGVTHHYAGWCGSNRNTDGRHIHVWMKALRPLVAVPTALPTHTHRHPLMAVLQVNTKRDAKYTLKASYLEIYNEGVYDLVHFSPKAKSLPVKWDASYGFYVQGLKVGIG